MGGGVPTGPRGAAGGGGEAGGEAVGAGGGVEGLPQPPTGVPRRVRGPPAPIAPPLTRVRTSRTCRKSSQISGWRQLQRGACRGAPGRG